MDSRKLDRRQVCLNSAGREALLAALRRHFPKYPQGIYPDRWQEVTRVDQRTVAKMLVPNQRVRHASIDSIFKDLGAVYQEDAYLEQLAVDAMDADEAEDETPASPPSDWQVSPASVAQPSVAQSTTGEYRPRKPVDVRLVRYSAAIVIAVLAVTLLAHAIRTSHRAHTVATTPQPESANPPESPTTETETGTPRRVLLYDHFTADTALDPEKWTVNGPTARAALANLATSPVAIVAPKMTFDEQNGLGISGVDDAGQMGALQSVRSFTPPFTVTALCNATDIHGNALRLAISNAGGSAGVSLGFTDWTGDGSFVCSAPPNNATQNAHWVQLGDPLSPLPPAQDIWYVMAIAVDSAGKATVAVSSGDIPIGKATATVGAGPFNILIGQEGGQQGTSGQNQAYCGVIQVISKAEE